MVDLLADTGMNTTPGMWELVSDELAGCKLPTPINEAIYALREGRAKVEELEPCQDRN